jgi:hypothetical protein
MKKILYIFLAHVVVLGSLWIYRAGKDEDYSGNQEKYHSGQPVSLSYVKTDSSGLKVLICIDADELENALPGQSFNISMTSRAHEMESVRSEFTGEDSQTCFHIFLKGSISECVALTSGREE